MHGDDLDRLPVGLHHALRRRRSARPFVVDIAGELDEAADVVASGPFDEAVHVRERSRGLVAAAGRDDGADAQTLDGLGENEGGRRRVDAAAQVIQNGQHFPCDRIPDRRRIGPERQT
ncbi:hypothetical protein ABIA03_004281 [Bradyrhizobium yuanmingense]